MLAVATLVFVALAAAARTPMVAFNARAALLLLAAIVALLAIAAIALWRITRFS